MCGQYDEHQQHAHYYPDESAMHAADPHAAASSASGWSQSQSQHQQQQQQPQQYQQQQQQPPLQQRQQRDGDKNAELSQALREAESHPDPGMRQRMVKDIKQQMYKVCAALHAHLHCPSCCAATQCWDANRDRHYLQQPASVAGWHSVAELFMLLLQMELQQQIAEREAARQASKAATAAREATEAAARAAAPPPWDPASKLSRRGGGGEPLRGLDGAAVTDLRNQKHM
jgi:hypothetical protein